jgi:rare lipoprotein A
VLSAVALVTATAQAADAPPAAPRPAPGVTPRAEPGGSATITRDRLEGFATASGEPYSRNGMTGAHRTLPFGTLVRVTNMENNRKVVVRINDRMSAVGTRTIELTPRAAAVIGLQGIASVPVKLEVIGASGPRITVPGADEVK